MYRDRLPDESSDASGPVRELRGVGVTYTITAGIAFPVPWGDGDAKTLIQPSWQDEARFLRTIYRLVFCAATYGA